MEVYLHRYDSGNSSQSSVVAGSLKKALNPMLDPFDHLKLQKSKHESGHSTITGGGEAAVKLCLHKHSPTTRHTGPIPSSSAASSSADPVPQSALSLMTPA